MSDEFFGVLKQQASSATKFSSATRSSFATTRQARVFATSFSWWDMIGSTAQAGSRNIVQEECTG
jgi:hypothetical protein